MLSDCKDSSYEPMVLEGRGGAQQLAIRSQWVFQDKPGQAGSTQHKGRASEGCCWKGGSRQKRKQPEPARSQVIPTSKKQPGNLEFLRNWDGVTMAWMRGSQASLCFLLLLLFYRFRW